MPESSMTMRRFTIFVSALIAAAVLAACGSSGTTVAPAAGSSQAGSTPADHNAADVAFAQDMIPHHGQAVVMAGYAATRASNPQVKALAAEIAAAQGPEIVTMTGWLRTWGQPTAAASAAGMDMSASPGMAMGGTGTGMMSDQDMMSLGASKGTAFDTMFLTMMIRHHQGALTMAATELRDGSYGPEKQMAQSIQTSQTAQITTMKKLLAG